jgi:RNA polymerase sigma factor (sigma-70 family)
MNGFKRAIPAKSRKPSGPPSPSRKSRVSEKLLLEQIDLVKNLARRRIKSRHHDIDDMVGDGLVGLVKAGRNFAACKGAKFSTYANLRINGEMLDGIREWLGGRMFHRHQRYFAPKAGPLPNDETSPLAPEPDSMADDEELAQLLSCLSAPERAFLLPIVLGDKSVNTAARDCHLPAYLITQSHKAYYEFLLQKVRRHYEIRQSLEAVRGPR